MKAPRHDRTGDGTSSCAQESGHQHAPQGGDAETGNRYELASAGLPGSRFRLLRLRKNKNPDFSASSRLPGASARRLRWVPRDGVNVRSQSRGGKGRKERPAGCQGLARRKGNTTLYSQLRPATRYSRGPGPRRSSGKRDLQSETTTQR